MNILDLINITELEDMLVRLIKEGQSDLIINCKNGRVEFYPEKMKGQNNNG